MATDSPEGLRNRKKRQTRERIAQVGLQLCLEQGFEQTTLDEIADAADISRRTFFHHYQSKEELLKAWEGWDRVESVRDVLRKESNQQPPADAVRHCLMKMAVLREAPDALAIDRLMRSTEGLWARKQLAYLRVETLLAETLTELYPRRSPRSLRLVAMIAVGLWRLAQDAWHEDDGRHPFAEHLRKQYALHEKESGA